MTTYYLFVAGAQYSNTEVFGNLDPNGEYTDEQLARLREIYLNKIDAAIEAYDPTLRWLPFSGEIRCTDETTTDSDDFCEWWSGGILEDLMMESWMQLDEEIANA